MSAPHDVYERLGCVIISGHMSATQNKKGVWKKAFQFPAKWQTIQKHNYNKNASGFAMRTGHDVGMTAIDIDKPDLECAKALMTLMADCNMVQKTNKGYHYVYAFNASINQTTGTEETGIDTRNDGGCIFVEPSKAATPSSTCSRDLIRLLWISRTSRLKVSRLIDRPWSTWRAMIR